MLKVKMRQKSGMYVGGGEGYLPRCSYVFRSKTSQFCSTLISVCSSYYMCMRKIDAVNGVDFKDLYIFIFYTLITAYLMPQIRKAV